MTMNKILQNDYLGLLIRLVVGGIFIYAPIDKIFDPDQFARIIYNYHILPGFLVNPMAVILPWVELLCGLSLITGIYKEGSTLILNLLVLIFMSAIIVNLFRGIDIECGCFSVSTKAKTDALNLLMRDVGLLILTAYLYFNKSRRFTLFAPKG